jgi:hypothetical protein
VLVVITTIEFAAGKGKKDSGLNDYEPNDLRTNDKQ